MDGAPAAMPMIGGGRARGRAMSNALAAFVVALLMLMLIATVLVVAAGDVRRESFAEALAASASDGAEVVLYAENPLNHAGWPRRSGASGGTEWAVRAIDVGALTELLLSVGGDALPKAIVRGAKSVVAVLDPADATRLAEDGAAAGSVRELGLAPTGYFVTLTTLDVARSADPRAACTYEWRGRRIGYLERSDLMLIKAILKGYRIAPGDVELVRIPVARWDKLDEMLEAGEVHRIVAYVVPGGAHLGLIRRQRVVAQGFAGIDADRVAAFYPFARLEQRDIAMGLIMDRAMASRAHVLPKDADGPVFAMRQSVMLLAGAAPRDAGAKLAAAGGVATGAAGGAGAEGFTGAAGAPIAPDVASGARAGGAWRFVAPPDAYDAGYKCFGNLLLENKAECESAYDAVGNPKPEGPNVWDRPCFRDSDCPFWNEETEKIGRGGCAKGACEMAVGATATGFRKYSGTPFCYGCADPADENCCARQGDAPDYAFAGDYEARRAAGRDTMLVE